MKKIIVKFALFAGSILLVLTLFLYHAPFFYNGGEYPMWKSTIDYISKVHRAENIILGDSRAVAGFVPDLLDDDFYNLAVGGGSPIEAYYILKRYLEKKAVKKVIISLAPNHLEVASVFFGRTLRYNLLSMDEIDEVFAKSLELNENIHMSMDDYYAGKSLGYKGEMDYYKQYLKALSLNYKCFYGYIPELQNCLFDSRYGRNVRTYNSVVNRRGNYDFGLKPESASANDEAKKKHGFRHSRVLDFYLHKLLSLAQKNHIQTYFIVVPFNAASYNKITQQNSRYLAGYAEYVNDLKTNYDGVFWDAEIRSYDNSYFGDPSHLNQKGQQIFTRYVNDCLHGKKKN